MKKIFLLPALFILAAGILISCQKENAMVDDRAVNQPPVANVHVVGFEFNVFGPTAKYWKNGNPVSLIDTAEAGAFAIAVSGSDVYVAGYAFNGIGMAVAKYWKNGNSVSLSDGSRDTRTNAIAVSGSDAYVAGYAAEGTELTDANGNVYRNAIAKYWKNGNPVSLTDGSRYAQATAIAVSGNDIYVAGYEYDGNKYVAKYWKNGIPVSLSDGSEDAEAFAIAVSGGDVYMAGAEYNGSYWVAKYWKNDNPVSLSDGSRDTEALAIAVSGSDVYVAGNAAEGTELTDANGNVYRNRIAKYWKNGNPVSLTDGSRYAGASAIAVSGSDVYVSGYEYNGDGTSSVAKYWKNGNPVSLTDGSQYGFATGIALQP
jgi:hypothetical protein